MEYDRALYTKSLQTIQIETWTNAREKVHT